MRRLFLLLAADLVAPLDRHSGLLACAMYFVVGMFILSRSLAKKWVGSLEAVRECAATEPVEVGATVEVKVRLVNTGRTRVAWVLVEDLFPEHYLRQKPPRVRIKGRRMRLCSVPGGGSAVLQYEVESEPRGVSQPL